MSVNNRSALEQLSNSLLLRKPCGRELVITNKDLILFWGSSWNYGMTSTWLHIIPFIMVNTQPIKGTSFMLHLAQISRREYKCYQPAQFSSSWCYQIIWFCIYITAETQSSLLNMKRMEMLYVELTNRLSVWYQQNDHSNVAGFFKITQSCLFLFRDIEVLLFELLFLAVKLTRNPASAIVLGPIIAEISIEEWNRN
jgi:hypothetical protein